MAKPGGQAHTGVKTAATLLIAAGLLLRAWGMTRAIMPDELANLTVRPWYVVVFSAESAINPPLLRATMNALFDDATAPGAARALGVMCSALSLLAGAALARRLADDTPLAGWLGAAAIALSPPAIRVAATFRSYPFAGLFALLFALALVRWLEAPAAPPWSVVMTGAILCWLHYLWVPVVLGAVGWAGLRSPEHRRSAGIAAAWIAASLSPMIPLVLRGSSAAVAPDTPWRDLIEVASLGAWTPTAIVAWFPPSLGTDAVRRAALPALGVAVAIVGCAVAAVRAPPARAVVPAMVVLLTATAAASAQVQVVRSPVASFLAVLLLPLGAAGLSSLEPRPRRRLITGGAAVAYVLVTAPAIHDAMTTDLHAGLRSFAQGWRAWDGERAGRPILVAPSYAPAALFWNMNGLAFGSYEPGPRCEGLPSCFEQDGVLFSAWDRDRPLPEGGALVVAFDDRADPAWSRCALLWEQPFAQRVYDCRP